MSEEDNIKTKELLKSYSTSLQIPKKFLLGSEKGCLATRTDRKIMKKRINKIIKEAKKNE